MELKKNPKSDVYLLTGVLFNVGLLISIGLLIMAFEWRFFESAAGKDLVPQESFEETLDEIPQTDFTPPPPVLQQPEIVEVPDEQEVEEQLVNLNTELDEKKAPPPPPKVKPKEKDPPKIVKKEEEDFDKVFEIVEQNAEPEGGMEAFYKYVAKEMTYPAVARRMGVEGKVFVQFVVDKDGKLTEVEVVKGISKECDEEAVRVLEKAKPWTPAQQRGRPVRVKMVIPIQFKLK